MRESRGSRDMPRHIRFLRGRRIRICLLEAPLLLRATRVQESRAGRWSLVVEPARGEVIATKTHKGGKRFCAFRAFLWLPPPSTRHALVVVFRTEQLEQSHR